MVVRELLRTEPRVRVRALVRSASRPEGYARLSYEVGAEDARYLLRPAWSLNEEGGLAWQTELLFDEVQREYGLDRLEMVECDLRYAPDVKRALEGVSSVIWCASDFDGFRRRPERLDNAMRGISRVGLDSFELRWPGFGRPVGREGEAVDSAEEEARREAVAGKGVDDDGLRVALEVFCAQRTRRERVRMLTGGATAAAPPTQFVLASAAAALGYDDNWGEARESEFGYRKRQAEAALRECAAAAAKGAGASAGLPYAIVRAARLDNRWIAEGLPVQSATLLVAETPEGGAAGAASEASRSRRINPRDFARALASALRGEVAPGGGDTREVWTATRP